MHAGETMHFKPCYNGDQSTIQDKQIKLSSEDQTSSSKEFLHLGAFEVPLYFFYEIASFFVYLGPE